MDNINSFKNGYKFASNNEKTFDDMHSKFESLQENETSAFMLGYVFYLIETAKFLDGASVESLSAKMHIGIAQQCLNSIITEKNLSNEDSLKLCSTLYEMAGENSIEDVANSVFAIH